MITKLDRRKPQSVSQSQSLNYEKHRYKTQDTNSHRFPIHNQGHARISLYFDMNLNK